MRGLWGFCSTMGRRVTEKTRGTVGPHRLTSFYKSNVPKHVMLNLDPCSAGGETGFPDSLSLNRPHWLHSRNKLGVMCYVHVKHYGCIQLNSKVYYIKKHNLQRD